MMDNRTSCRRLLAATGLFALTMPAAAHATATLPIIYAPQTRAAIWVNAPPIAPAFPYGVSNAIGVKNGVLDGSFVPYTLQGPGYAGPDTANNLTNTSAVAASITRRDTSLGATYASLATGKVGAFVLNNFAGQPGEQQPYGSTWADWKDTAYINNTTGHAVTIPVTFSFDGSILGAPPGNPNASGGHIGMYLWDGGAQYWGRVTFANDPNGGFGGWTNFGFNAAGVYGENSYLNANGGDTLNPNDFTVSTTYNPVTGKMTGTMTALLSFAPGFDPLGVGAGLYLGCQNTAKCDFAHTGSFTFGALPTGVTLSSASGQLFTGLGAVPEPGSWALMLAGLGLAGAALRRRRQALLAC